MLDILVEVEIKWVIKIFKIEIYIVGVKIIIKNTFSCRVTTLCGITNLCRITVTWDITHLADYCAVVADDFVIFFYVVKESFEGLGIVWVDKVNHSGFVKEALGFFVVKGLKGRKVAGDGGTGFVEGGTVCVAVAFVTVVGTSVTVAGASIVQDYLGDVAKTAGVFRKTILQGKVGFGIPGFVDGLHKGGAFFHVLHDYGVDDSKEGEHAD